MKTFRILTSNNKFGLIETSSNEVQLPYVYDSIENYFDKYFFVTKAGSKSVLNTQGEIIFELNNKENQKEFAFESAVYRILCVEAKQDVLIFYGENIDKSIPVEQQVCQLSIKDKSITPNMLSKTAYLSSMNAETGFNVDFKN